jgi:AbrB family looped-hinge helix DNA binding protein
MGLRWYSDGMRATIDGAGRLVVPKPVRERLGLVPGEVELEVDGSDLRIRPISGDAVDDDDGWLVVPAAGVTVTDDDIRALRDADQR